MKDLRTARQAIAIAANVIQGNPEFGVDPVIMGVYQNVTEAGRGLDILIELQQRRENRCNTASAPAVLPAGTR